MKGNFQYDRKRPAPDEQPEEKKQKIEVVYVGEKSSYTKIEKIGKGGFGNVMKARDNKTGELVAVKVFKHHPNLGYERARGRIAEFNGEYDVYLALGENSPHILKLMDRYKTGDKEVFLVTELMDGNLDGYVLEDSTAVRNVVSQLLEGFLFMHKKGVVHRDINLNNILYRKRPTFLDAWPGVFLHQEPKALVCLELVVGTESVRHVVFFPLRPFFKFI